MVVVGIDEVGRGPWAGPLTVAAVGLAAGTDIGGLTDSKLLSARQRQRLLPIIQSRADFVFLQWVSPATIDSMGLGRALRRAVLGLIAQLPLQLELDIVIDGNVNYADSDRVRTMVRADRTVPAVAAASVVAKVRRDNYMIQIDRRFARYGFARHKGYGTDFHRQALRRFGPSALHRQSFRPVTELAYE